MVSSCLCFPSSFLNYADQEWRNFKKIHTSQYHILSKIHSQIVFSNSIKPESKQLPRYKLNVSLQKLKINMSDSRIVSLINFMNNVPSPKSHTVLHLSEQFSFDNIKLQDSLKVLEKIQHLIACSELRTQLLNTHTNKEELKKSFLTVEKSGLSSEVSDEDSEIWARILDLPGFDDNVSQNNVIIYLFRINIVQIIIELKRSSSSVDKPYIILHLVNFCCDTAFMEYGPAVQVSLGSISIVDKLHCSVNSNQTQILSTNGKPDVISILYRKVRSDCPDFKSHFHSVEQSLVIEINTVHVVFHKEALVDLYRYLQYFSNKFKNRSFANTSVWVRDTVKELYKKRLKTPDPPIPAGATKFSYSTRISDVKFQLCDTEIDFLLIRVAGFELDCMFKTDERLIFRAYLMTFTIDDISNTSLYPKILSVEEEKLMEIKYVRRSRRLSKTNIETNADDIKSDGVFKFHFSRIHVVVMFKLIYDIQKFFSPFVPAKCFRKVGNFLEKSIERFLASLRFSTDKIHVSVDFQLPTFLLPQQASSPNLIIFNAGDLTVENFFKELATEEENKTPPVIDNALIKLDSVIISRAIVNFNGSIIVQETIMGPVCCKTDTKRLLLNSTAVNEYDSLSMFDINTTIDMITINLGQKDFSTLNLIWIDSILKILAFWNLPKDKLVNSCANEEVNVRKLEAFFYQVESNRKQVTLHVNFEGLLLCLYNDIDEVLSSPVRDENRSLCKFKIGETAINGVIYANGKTEHQLSVQSLLLEDTRVNNTACIKRIFQSYGATYTQSNNENVCITVPPVISIMLNKNQLGESHCNVLIDHTRLNLGVSFLMELFRFFIEATPYDQDNAAAATTTTAPVTNNGGVVNYGYSENCEAKNGFNLNRRRTSNDPGDDTGGLSLSITCRKPEIMLFSQLEDYGKSHALLLRADLSMEYVRHPTNVSFTFNVSDLHMLSKLQSTLIKTSSNVVLQPCNIEISKNWAAVNEETKISISCDKVNLHISASTVHTILNIIREVDSYFFTEPTMNKCETPDNFYQDCDDLWSAKKITPYCLPQKQETTNEQLPTYVISEIMILSIPSVKIMFEIEDVVQKKPVLLLKLRAEAKLKNWSNSLEMKGDISMQCSYYNFKVNAWEPILEPCVKTENIYRPWEITIKAFKSKSYPISIILSHNKTHRNSISKKKTSVSSTKESVRSNLDSETSAGEDDCGSIRSVKKTKMHADRTERNFTDSGSDSENEDTIMEKLKTRFGQLLIGESSDENTDTDSDISLNEQSFNNNSDDNTDEDTMSHLTNNSFLLEKRAVFITKQRESDTGLESANYDKSATYIILETQERFEMVITPSTISVIKQILDSFSLKFNNILTTDTQILSLKNDIAPHSTVILQSKSTVGPMKILMCASYSLSESSPSSPGSTIGSPCNVESPTDLEFQSGIENFEGGFASDAYSKTDSAKRKSDGDILLNALQFPRMSVDILYSKVMDRQLYVTVNGFEDLTVICPTKTTNKYHALQPAKNNTRYYVVVSVQNDLWGQSITVRSPLQMKNETCFPLALYYKKNALDNTGFDQIGELTNPFEDSFKFAILEPDEVYNMPLMITYHCAVYVLPIYEEYHLSETGLWWKELANDISTPKDVICQPKNEKSPVFAIRAITSEGVHFSNPCSRTLPNFMISLIPSVFVFNLLPCAFQIKIPSAEFNIRIEAGGKASIYSLDMNTRHAVSFEVPMYFGISWTGTFHMYNKMEEKTLSMTTDQDTDGGNKHLTLNVRVDKAESYNVMVYSPYWIVNKTGLPLQLKGSSSDVVYETLVEEPLFFAFRKTQKRNIRLRVYQSSWSSAFSIDTAGCSGLITCRDRERNRSYYILVEITLSQLNPQLTKIVTLLPYFLISNESRFAIRYMEENEQADLWIDLPQNQTIPFWPETNTMKMYIKYRDSSLVSQHFYINQACQTVLRMDKGSAIVVDIVGGDNKPFLIAFQDYKIGDAPVRIDNFCEDLFLKVSQENSGQVTLLSPYQSLLYTWDDPTLERKLQWNVYNRKNKGFMANFKTEGYGQEYVSFKLIKQQTLSNSIKTNKLSSSLKKFTSKYTAESSSSGEESERDDSTDVSQMIKTHKGKVVVYWVSYLEGPQRVLLFTQDEQVAFYAYSRIDSERSNVELFLSIKGIGLSLVTEQKNVSRELAYISVNDSASIWEVNIAHSWKILPLELATWLEHQWSQGIKKAQLKDYVNVDLDKMQLIKPFFGELKRTYQPAFWLHCRKSFNYYYFQWKVHKFQVDNQLPNSVFQSVIYPKIVSYDVIRKYGLKPCLEGTFIKKRSSDYERDVYKYIKFMALEFCVQVDKQFVLSVHELMQPWSRSESSSLRIRADICKVHHPLVIKFHNNYKNLRKTVVEYLYFSPIKIQFSFTSQNVQHLQTNFSNQTYVKACLHYVLNCISCGYVDFKGVKLKCPYFEESGTVTHVPSKLREIRYHYFHNLIRQMYSHILGPDSACNSNNEVDLCEEYVEFYYDLSLGFLKKVDEFAEAISEAARCLLSHITTSSVNSTSSLIMCGKRISLDLGLNPEIIKKKSITQQISFEEPEEVLRGDSCFEIGVLYGLSGVFMNIPICNQQEGIELFFRTAGKHLLRLLNKYSNTISSMPVTAIDGIKRAAETGTDITFRRRLPKYINPFGMKPFSVHHAIGLNILHSINKGIYAETDDYWTHVILTNDGRSCLLITLQRIFLISKVRMWDDWKIEWCIGVNDIIEVPQVIDSKLMFKIRQEESVHNLFTDDKLIEHEDVNLLFWMQKMIEIVFIINLENKPCFFVESQVLRK
ncbi:intermembrane lipid transfer protein VPS13A-like isoform X2 [Planococcus citri]|uniref:intermembrane lipid transfer protein VPS13A-like isoform X2 n=1 Tax=Planococcus citri TaxID=170843 RepID=UPI0031F79566